MNYIAFQTRQYKHKTAPIVAKTMLAVAEAKRQERNARNPKMGLYSSDFRIFTEGEYLTSLRKSIFEAEQQLAKSEKPRGKNKNEEQVRALSSA